jgi:hypothetical protein
MPKAAADAKHGTFGSFSGYCERQAFPSSFRDLVDSLKALFASRTISLSPGQSVRPASNLESTLPSAGLAFSLFCSGEKRSGDQRDQSS